MERSNEQEKAYLHNEGALLLLASAGSGKTRVLVDRIKRLVEEKEGGILAITFTNKACNEMQERLGDEKKYRERVTIRTFHSFAEEVVRNRGVMLGIKKQLHIFEDDAERKVFLKEAFEQDNELEQTFIKQKEELEPKEFTKWFNSMLDEISKIKRNIQFESEEWIDNQGSEVVRLYNNYQSILRNDNSGVDFDDILLLAYQLFSEKRALSELYSKSYKYVCIDEAQDMNLVQYKLLRAMFLGHHNNIFMVGDDKQSIYAFNDSSPDYMAKEFVSDFKAKELKLSQNFRCAKEIVKLANRVIDRGNGVGSYAFNGKVSLYTAHNTYDEARFVLEKINEIIKSKEKIEGVEYPIDYSNFTVIARSSYLFSDLVEVFSESKIPHAFNKTSLNINFSSELLKAIMLAIRTKINPDDKLSANKLEEALSGNRNLEKYIDIIENIDKKGENFKLQLDLIKVKLKEEFNSNNFEDEEAFLELEKLKQFWSDYKKTTDRPSMASFRNSLALGKIFGSEEAKNEVKLSTAHAMKGLENDIVFLIGADEGSFPFYKATTNEAKEQERNLMYVAITRAKRQLYISYPQERVMPWGDKKRRSLSTLLKMEYFN